MSATHPSLPPSPAPRPGPALHPGSASQPGTTALPSSTLQGPPAPPQERLLLPGQRLTPSPDRDRPWRVLTVLLGASVVLLMVGGLAVASAVNWAAGRGYTEISAATGLGTPVSLSLDSLMGTVQVLPSDDVDEVTLALVEPGTTRLPAPQDRVRARLTHDTDSSGATVTVDQPQSRIGLPWTDHTRDVLLLVPSGLELSLEVHAGIGDVLVDGEFSTLDVRTDVGDVALGPVSASDELTVTSEVGDVDIELESPAPTVTDITAMVGDVDLQLPTESHGSISIASEMGDVIVTAPGNARWHIVAASELGSVWVDPGLTADSGTGGGALSVTTDFGDITIAR